MRVSQKFYPPSVLKETAEYSFANCNLGRKDKRYLDQWYDYGAMRVWLKLLAHKKKTFKKKRLAFLSKIPQFNKTCRVSFILKL